jgi:hypothetical protein
MRLDDDMVKAALECEGAPLICTGIKLVVLHVQEKGKRVRAAVSSGKTGFVRKNGDSLTVLANRDLAKILREKSPAAVLSIDFLQEKSHVWIVNISAQDVDGDKVLAIGCGDEKIAIVRTTNGWQCKSQRLETNKR